MRRAIAVTVALVLAGLGTFLLVRFVQGAEDRALEGQVPVDVLVADEPIVAGTPVEDLAGQVSLERIPAKVAADGAVSDLEPFVGMVAAIDLLPGEQITASRLLTAEEYAQSLGPGAKVEVPADMLQVTLGLTPDRVVGGQVKPGDVVAVFASFDPSPLGYVEPTGLSSYTLATLESQGAAGLLMSPESTRILLHKVLVTNIQAEEVLLSPTDEESAEGTFDLAPTRDLLVTLALDPVSAERLVFAAEYGRVWLAIEGSGVDETSTEIQTRAGVYETP